MTIQDELNRANPNNVPDLLRKIQVGDVLNQLPKSLRSQSPNTAPVSPYQLGTVQTTALGAAPAASILRATARAGAITGELVSDGYAAAAPLTGHIAIAPNGDIVTLIADALTDLDINYIPEKGDIVELILPVPSGGVLAISSAQLGGRKIVLLREAEMLTGGVIGKKAINLPGTAAATAKAALNAAKTSVVFLAGDAGTGASARVRLFCTSLVDLTAGLAAAEI